VLPAIAEIVDIEGAFEKVACSDHPTIWTVG
jgi:hypothetical protein